MQEDCMQEDVEKRARQSTVSFEHFKSSEEEAEEEEEEGLYE
jgi:hypothetical protein